MKKKEIMQFFKDNKKKLFDLGVKHIGLFGSFATKKEKKDSDIDVLVEFKNNCETFDNYFDLKFFLEDTLQRNVDLVIKNTLKPRIKQKVIAEAEYA